MGDIADGEMRLNDFGCIVAAEWVKSADIRREIACDEWVVMPNHVHGIVRITFGSGDRRVCPPMKPRSLSSFVTGFKSAATKRINILRNAPCTPVWQRNYYKHIIRDDDALWRIRRYIRDNPATWRQ